MNSQLQFNLDEIYLNYLEFVSKDPVLTRAIDEYELSSPQLIDLDTSGSNYENADLKIVFVGKETNGWFNANQRVQFGLEQINGCNHEEYLKALKSIYRNHLLGVNYNSPIFQFIHAINNTLKEQVNAGIILTELLRHDQHGKKAQKIFRDRFMYANNYILRAELEALNPDVIVFLTGPGYDNFIHATFAKPVYSFFNQHKFNWTNACKISGIPRFENVIRLSHPGYYNRLGAHFKHDMASAVIEYMLNLSVK